MEKMEQVKAKENEEVIDLLHILAVLWRKAWVIVLAGVLLAAICFSWATFMVPATYSSTVMMYVNNEANLGSFSISMAELNAAQSLVKTYLVILRSRETLLMALEKAGSDHTYEELEKMITASAVDNTEIFSVTVTAEDPEEAARLASAIAEVLPTRVESVINGASMRIVSGAIANPKRVAPSITRYTAIGLLVGMLIASVIIVVLDLLNDVIRDENHILQTYDIPILAQVPDLLDDNSARHGYYGG